MRKGAAALAVAGEGGLADPWWRQDKVLGPLNLRPLLTPFAWSVPEKPVFSSLSSSCVVFSRLQERAKVDAERKALEKLRAFYSELKSQLENCPESMREQLKDQMQRVSASSIPAHLQWGRGS